MNFIDNDLLVPLVAAGLGFVAVLLLVLAAGEILAARGRNTRLRNRLLGESGGRANLGGRLARGASNLGRKLGPKDEEELGDTGTRLMRAGFAGPNAPAVFFGAKAALALAGVGVTAVLHLAGLLPVPMGLLALLFVLPAAAGMYVPNVWLSMRIATRRREILNAMPDALDLLVVCVEAGMGLDQALARVTREIGLSSRALGEELHKVILELRAGKPRADALRNLAHRVDLEDVTSLVTLIIQADAFGTSIAKTLRVYSDSLRTTRYQRAEEIAAKMPVKLLFPLVFCILPALFVAIMGPAGITLMHTFSKMN